MYFVVSLFVAFLITLFSVSKIAKMLNAKRFDVSWVFFALLLSGILATAIIIALDIFLQVQDPKIMLAITLASAFVVSSAAYKYINKLNWSGAFTLNVASMAIGILTLVTAIVINGESINETFDKINISAKNNTSIVSSMEIGTADASTIKELKNTEDETSENEDSVITELDFLPAGTVRDIKRKEKKVYIEPKFRVVSLGDIRSAVGHRIRIYRKNGNMITGALKRVDGNDAVISRYTSKGTVIMPISIAKIHKLEVYK